MPIMDLTIGVVRQVAAPLSLPARKAQPALAGVLIALILSSALAIFPVSTQAAELTLSAERVAPGVYVIVGDLGPQTYENDGLNANLGFVETVDGVIVIDTGPSLRVARALHQAIRRVTQKPIAFVVNTNSQSQRWLGNAFFQAMKVPILAHRSAASAMKEQAHDQLQALRSALREKAANTVSAFPSEFIDGRRIVQSGGAEIHLLPLGPAHTAGEVGIWLPASGILFAGDIVYTERLLAILPAGNTRQWLAAFDALAGLKPRVLIPGHGRPTDLVTATRDTRDYLSFVRASVKSALDERLSVQETMDRIDQSRFSRLVNFEQLARRNVYHTYLEMEFE